MFKIGEFSKITQVSVRMLRYYDENQILVPEKVDETTGYRLYASRQITQVNRIIFLKNLGFNIAKIRECLENWESNKIQTDLELQAKEIELSIQQEQEKLIRLRASLYDLERQQLHLNTQIVIKSLPACHVFSVRKVVPDYFHECELWQELEEKMPDAEGLSCFSIYHDFDYKEQDVDIEACVVEDGTYRSKRSDIVKRQVTAVAHAACFMVYGPYENIGVAYREFGMWLAEHPEYQMCGQNRQICHVSACNTNNPAEYVTELQVPIEIADTHVIKPA